MDKDRVEGVAKKAKASVKEALGKVTGNTGLEDEGKAEKVAGRMEDAAGKAKDASRDVIEK